MPTYLFDFDGTLVDSMPTFEAIMLRILDEYKIEYTSDIIKIITPLGYHGTAEYFRSLGIPSTATALTEKMMAYAAEEYEKRVPAKAGTVEALTQLKSRGASLNVLTASPHAMLDPCLKRLGIWDLFDNVWSCDDFETTKANPEIYRLAAEKMGCEVGEVIFVDDNVNAVATAKSAGMRSWGIFDLSSASYIEEMKRTADRYVMRLDELLSEV